ncbi:MAG TPA: PSD1 and planctomycete cytochrome C domain-containing protein [Verrucomicrobiae bacterium]|nr:PSD1 and planctomycete cytochrome C domain-containing protein [Verrucomicrobiae bacterium]
MPTLLLAAVRIGLAIDPAKLPPATRQVEFVRDIQPIFAEHCLACHGPKKQEAEFRLDAKDIALKGGELGTAILPGKSAESLLIRLVAEAQPGKFMPKKGERLTSEQIGLLRAWIDQGAVWPDSASVKTVDPRKHWAFKPPVRPTEPKVKNSGWVRNPIDSFILSRLEREGLQPSPEADRVTLIRRLSLDLTGLPPTLEEIDRFLADNDPQAYRNLVEHYLASPHYGERWGRHWLDVARYADSNGYEKDLPRSIWPYRDWVINALNRDLPFDQFTIEQLAGDLLPNATLEQKVATGFLRNSMVNEEGGVDPEQFRVEAIIDRIDTVGKAFLGLTVNCAQCHNHKYDPIKQKEYYQLFAFLNNDDEPQMEVPNEEQQAKRRAILRSISEIEDRLLAETPDVAEKMSAWETQMKDLVRKWEVLDPMAYYGAVGTKFTKLSDKSLLATASSPPVSAYTISVKTKMTNITGFRLEVLRDPNLPMYGPGRAKNGNFVLTEFTAWAAPESDPAKTNRIVFTNATADMSQKDFPISAAIDGINTNKTGWGADGGPGRRNLDHRAVFEAKEPMGYPAGTVLTFHMEQVFGSEHTIGRFRLSATTGSKPLKADPLSVELREIVSRPSDKRSKEEDRKLFSAYRITDKRFADDNKKINDQMDQWPTPPTTLVLAARPDPRETHIFKRGDFRKPGESVVAGVPAILNPLPKDAPLNRLTLAKWLVDKRHPTVARVIVNRIWQQYFGRGLVSTAEDLGTQGDKPSHPELLDWLATEFMEQGWSIKHIHRLIANSATYRQSSLVSPQLYERDQFNILLARGPRFRVESEIIRDIALSASGLLSPRIGGPSVYPPIPEGVLSLGYGVPMAWPIATNDNRFRRGMYTFWKRAVPYPSMLAFDSPTGEFSCPRRIRSNTPLQALTTLNDPAFFEAAQALGMRVLKEGAPSPQPSPPVEERETERARGRLAFRLCTGRKPDETELNTVLQLYRDQLADLEEHTMRAVTVASHDPKNPAADVNLHKAAAWTMVSRVLLNLDETVTKQ